MQGPHCLLTAIIPQRSQLLIPLGFFRNYSLLFQLFLSFSTHPWLSAFLLLVFSVLYCLWILEVTCFQFAELPLWVWSWINFRNFQFSFLQVFFFLFLLLFSGCVCWCVFLNALESLWLCGLSFTYFFLYSLTAVSVDPSSSRHTHLACGEFCWGHLTSITALSNSNISISLKTFFPPLCCDWDYTQGPILGHTHPGLLTCPW